jgi:hypothetical protein
MRPVCETDAILGRAEAKRSRRRNRKGIQMRCSAQTSDGNQIGRSYLTASSGATNHKEYTSNEVDQLS